MTGEVGSDDATNDRLATEPIHRDDRSGDPTGGVFDNALTRAGVGPGCAMLIYIFAIVALIGVVLLAVLSSTDWGGLLAGVGDGDNGVVVETETAVVDSTTAENRDFLPRSGTWDIENLPFLPDCGPGSLGSGFQEGTIEVIDDGAFIIASGSQPGTASIELSLVDAAPGRLVYLGVESITGMEMTMTFSSPTEMEATVSNGGDICLERPATGVWDREIGAPDPDAEESMSLPEWLPAGFPMSGGGQVGVIETETTRSVTIIVEDRPPTDVLFEVASWAVDQGYAVLERGMSTYTFGIDESRQMYIEVVDIGNFNTQLTVTIEDL